MWDIHAYLMLLCLLYLWNMISTKKKNWKKLLSISLPSCFRGHPGLAKYHIFWTTLVDTFYQMPSHWPVQFGQQLASAYVSVMAISWQITSTNLLQREVDSCLQNPPVSQNNYPSSYDHYLFITARVCSSFCIKMEITNDVIYKIQFRCLPLMFNRQKRYCNYLNYS